jgi:hypothetical protein
MTKEKLCPNFDGKTCKKLGRIKIIHSRNKGNSYERKIAKLISKWCGFEVVRTPGSGSVMKTGDIFPKNPEDMISFPFSIELKNREGWSFGDLIKDVNRKNGIISWWEQCLNDSVMHNRIPVLIFTKNLDINYCLMDKKSFNNIIPLAKQYYSISYMNYIIFDLKVLLSIPYGDIIRRLE